jgi:hypothetical protein
VRRPCHNSVTTHRGGACGVASMRSSDSEHQPHPTSGADGTEGARW